ncbi:MAG TPA: methyltransferase domain-containing protein [Gemmatimonadaceae bacterium]|nr:methyltransferase domain-containing protein [Gemmatimonadaceae bacterium]
MPQTLEAPPHEIPYRRSTIADVADQEEYRSFGNMESRNGLQERFEIPLLVRALRLPQGGRVLEVGCGRGVALPVLAERLRPASLVGVDVDRSLVEVARQRVVRTGTRAEVQVADVRALPFEDGSFDLVIDFGTCYHVSGGVAGRSTALREIGRVLRAGGLFVHETPVAQMLAHPVRSFGRRLPWAEVALLTSERRAVLWSARRRGAAPRVSALAAPA